jgi:putative ABC transport system permease protein
MRELQYALRRLRGSPMFTIAATLTLAIAIGATASVFSVVDGVLLKAFPFRDADRVLTIWETNSDLHLSKFTVAPANYLDSLRQDSGFTALAAASI